MAAPLATPGCTGVARAPKTHNSPATCVPNRPGWCGVDLLLARSCRQRAVVPAQESLGVRLCRPCVLLEPGRCLARAAPHSATRSDLPATAGDSCTTPPSSDCTARHGVFRRCPPPRTLVRVTPCRGDRVGVNGPLRQPQDLPVQCGAGLSLSAPSGNYGIYRCNVVRG